MADGASGARPELELKYLLPAPRTSFVLRWLDGVASPERAYPPALVVTTYFDTPDLRLLDEKIDSDFLKSKMRVRWYAPLDGAGPTGPAFVEVKTRKGATRGKHRIALPGAAPQLASLALEDRGWADLVAALGDEARSLPRGLAPVLRLAYARYRYLEARGARISVDAGIEVQAVNRQRLLAPTRRGALPWTVFEYKSHATDLPGHLAPLVRFGARRSAFSKYLACYEHVTREVF